MTEAGVPALGEEVNASIRYLKKAEAFLKLQLFLYVHLVIFVILIIRAVSFNPVRVKDSRERKGRWLILIPWDRGE